MKKLTQNRFLLLAMIGVSFLLVGAGILLNSYAYAEPIKSISFTSKNLNYGEKEAGSFQVKKSAEWVALNKAKITFEIDSIAKENTQNRDIILVLDLSDSMEGEKLAIMKAEVINLIDKVLEDTDNRIAVIAYGTNADTVSIFSNNPRVLARDINLLSNKGQTNHYDALRKVEKLLSTYEKKEGRECSVVFLTDGYADKGTPNELLEYAYLKTQYPYLTIKAVQYEMGDQALPAIQLISDYQYVANVSNLGEVLRKVAGTSVLYDKFELIDWIQPDYFTAASISSIEASLGTVKLTEEDGVQKVTWHMDTFQTGTQEKLTINLNLKSDYQKDVGFFATNQKEAVQYKLGNVEETVSSNSTPILATHYDVSYDTNAPSGCSVSETPETQTFHVLNMIKVSDNVPTCKGYQFQGWKIVTPNVQQYNKEYFIMPETDVLLKAEWTKMSIAKTVDGLINVKRISTLQSVGSEAYNEKLWKYKPSISRIVFQDVISSIHSEIESFDVSQRGDGSVVARIVANGDGTHTAYIQGDGTIYANPMSAYLFYGFQNLQTVENLGILDTSNVTNMASMFADCPKLTTMDLSHFNTSNVTEMTKMFFGCSSLVNLDLSHFDTSKVLLMTEMFKGCTNLASINLSSFQTPSVVMMKGMFQGCENLVSLNLDTFTTSRVVDMSFMFSGCHKLGGLDLSRFDTTNVNDMNNMFNECYSLQSLGLSNFNTANVTSMSSMFAYCTSLTTLDISNFVTANVTDMGQMFSSCEKLPVINVGHFDTSKVVNMALMFYNCKAVGVLDVTNFNTARCYDMNMMFDGCSSLTTLDVSHFVTSNVTNMANMFSSCSSLTALNVSGFDTSNVTDMSVMFRRCSSLTALDVSHFNTAKVMDMNNMFDGCRNLLSLDVSHFDTSLVTGMIAMFASCGKLTSLDVSRFITTNVTDMSYMFAYCEQLTGVELSGFDTTNVTDMSYMFDGCTAISGINVSNFNTAKVTNMTAMFSGCKAITSLDLKNFNTSLVKGMSYMFAYNTSLSSIDLSSFDTSNVSDMSYMFDSCTQISTIKLDHFDTANVNNMKNMFQYCYHINATLNISSTPTTVYENMLFDAATATGASLKLNYTNESSSLVDRMLTTKSATSNVTKGTLIV